ncbi:MAG: caspase family protein [Actinobacteria bacterium]|nr:caspase family protein [Actinomycetota bacterium]
MGYRALLIANSSFPADPHNLQPLVGPVNDVAVLRAALADPGVGLFEPESVRLVPERTAQEVLVELERFFSAARRDDTLLLYYSGHGVLNERNQLFLCARCISMCTTA